MKNFIIGLMFICFFFAQQGMAQATFVDGKKLKEWSDAAERHEAGNARDTDAYVTGLYMGYVEGVADIMDGTIICLSGETTVGQVTAIVTKFLKDNPEKWKLPANYIIGYALTPVFPCNKK